MQSRIHITIVTAAVVLAVASGAASAAPSDDQVAQARADCWNHKQSVNGLEKKVGEDSPQLKQAFRSWEASCAHAQALMDERDGKPVLQAELPPEDDGTRTASQQ
jgi:hypothetical protein